MMTFYNKILNNEYFMYVILYYNGKGIKLELRLNI